MANKKSLLGGVSVKVENRSGFDKSRFNAFTAPLGAIVPMVKQLVLPGSGKLSVKLSAQLPPLAADAFLRSHLKVEAFLCPMRLCYGGFQSWFSGEKITTSAETHEGVALVQAELPRLEIPDPDSSMAAVYQQNYLDHVYGVHTLMDYFGVKAPLSSGKVDQINAGMPNYYNIFPFLAYQLIYHHYYRNKLIQRPLFAPPEASAGYNARNAACLPYLAYSFIKSYGPQNMYTGFYSNTASLLNGDLLQLRQRNYGFDYFTTALPSAQDGNPLSVSTAGNTFTISSLRIANSLQEFAERNQFAGPDYLQVVRARYGKAPSEGVASRPILLGSADFPMFTSGVEQSAPNAQSGTGNPFAGIGARYGRAHAEGSDFVCEFNCDEPSYLMVMCSLVPEANYATGIQKDMVRFTDVGSIVELPNAQLERAGMEPILTQELCVMPGYSQQVFGYQPRYMDHKIGVQNEVHGLFRAGASLEAFIPQRHWIALPPYLDSAFLQVAPTDLDNVTAVSGAISQYGVMIDSAIELYVSEPLGESVVPSLVDPAAEHGQSVYLKRGGISVNS